MTTPDGTVDVSTLHYIPLLRSGAMSSTTARREYSTISYPQPVPPSSPSFDIPADPSAAGATADFATLLV